jgi:hypothetical protein
MGCVQWVGLVGDPIFVVSGSPVNYKGNISLDLADQSGNLVLASPDGATGKPTFRALVAADIPPLPPPIPPGPSTLTNLKLWFDATQGTYQDTGLSVPATANNDPVRGWKDLSPSGFNATDSTGMTLKTNYQNGNSALLSVAALYNQLILSTEFGTTSDCAVFVAVQPPSSYKGVLLASQLGSQYLFDFDDLDLAYPAFIAWDGTHQPISDTAAFSPGVFGIWSFVRTSGVAKLYWNGQPFAVTPSAFAGYIGIGRISANSGPILFFDGHIGEIFLAETTVDDATRQRMENYLSQKWIPQPYPYVKSISAGPGIEITGPGTTPTIAVKPSTMPGLPGSVITSGTVDRAYMDATFQANLYYATGILSAGLVGAGYPWGDITGAPSFGTDTLTHFAGTTLITGATSVAFTASSANGLHGCIALKNTDLANTMEYVLQLTNCWGDVYTAPPSSLSHGIKTYLLDLDNDSPAFSASYPPYTTVSILVNSLTIGQTVTFEGYASIVG